MLSFRLFFETGDGMIAGPNMYSHHPKAFDETSETIGVLLATHGALALANASARQKNSNQRGRRDRDTAPLPAHPKSGWRGARTSSRGPRAGIAVSLPNRMPAPVFPRERDCAASVCAHGPEMERGVSSTFGNRSALLEFHQDTCTLRLPARFPHISRCAGHERAPMRPPHRGSRHARRRSPERSAVGSGRRGQ